MYDLVINNGTIVTASAIYNADVAVDGEQIAAIGRDLLGRQTIDASGCYVVPGGVDIHVHMQMPLPGGVISADTFASGTRAAAYGGTTAIVDFVAAEADETLLDAFAKRRAEADGEAVIDYGFHMTITPDDIKKLDQLPQVIAAGMPTFKLYMAYGFCLNDSELLRAFQALAQVDGLPVVHAENWDVITTLIGQALAEGRTEPRWHPRCRPERFEAEAARRVIELADYAGLPVHIFHVSCAAVVDEIVMARGQGKAVSGETCPQYLFLTQDAYDKPGLEGTLPVCAPPLRPFSDQQALWSALSSGQIQLVTTDHCPFVKADKARGINDFSQIPGGVPSIEMRLSGVYEGVTRGDFSLSRWVDLCSTTPARLAGFTKKGEIAVGYDADLVVFDPAAEWTASTDSLHENADWTPYSAQTFAGRTRTTISRGTVLVTEGRFVGPPGHGRYCSRQNPTLP